jgi:hypothetical protein
MGDYTTLSALKTYLSITSTAHDALLTDLVTRASRLIDDHTGRWFEGRSETRYYDAIGQHISGRLLLFDADLYSLTSILNGDGQTITPDDMVLRPVNWPPYFGVSLKQGSGFRWGYLDSPEGAISVTGSWGYAATPPEPIKQAAVRLAAWLYRQRDTGGDGDEVSVSEQGVAFAPTRLPHDVRSMLGPYMRLRIKIMA